MMDFETAQRIQENAVCIHTQEDVNNTINRLADQISAELATVNPIICCVMNGGLVFTGQLLQHWNFPLQLDYVHTSRYQDSTVGSELIWQSMPKMALADRSILIVDDILDEGETLAAITQAFIAQGAKQVLSAVLIEKQHNRKHQEFHPDYVGLTVDDRYVFGSGMDYHGYFRNLNGIYALGSTDDEQS